MSSAGVERLISEANLHNPHREIGKSEGFPQDFFVAGVDIIAYRREEVDMRFVPVRKTPGNWRLKVGRELAALLLAIGWLAACDNRPLPSPSPVPTVTLVAPTTPPAPIPPPGAQPITIGELTAILDRNDRSCEDEADGERYPCLAFTVKVPINGDLRARLTWGNSAARLLLLIDDGRSFVNDLRGVSPLNVAMRAIAGGTYVISVWNLTGLYSPSAYEDERFELTTELETN